MKKWEYKIITENFSSYYIEENLNKLGEAGWELVATRTREGITVYIFKRQKNVKSDSKNFSHLDD